MYVEVPLDVYESFRVGRVGKKGDFALIAGVFQELGTFIRFIACELRLERTSDASRDAGILRLAPQADTRTSAQ